MPIPFSPGLIGLRLFGQFLIADPGGALYGLGAMSNGLLARLTL